MLRMLLFVILCIPVLYGKAQPKSIPAVKAGKAPVIDGILNDSEWAGSPVATDFIQNFPSYGATASVVSSVRILYTDEAVFIGAHLFDDPGRIRKQLTARDGEQRQDVDYFSVFFDTYHDLQNGFQFLVTSANVQSDARIGGNLDVDFGEFGDKTWDAVWQSQVKTVADGWIVEMKIPYISLRFSKRDIQTWGLQFLRFTRRNNESSYWNRVDPNINGFANQFGLLTEIKDIEPPLRLSFSPYLSGGVRINPVENPIRTQWLRNGGMDVKYGLNESFTLDATLIPDFGQVISDNIINNLSPFEIRFQENRPFFTEGTELFNKSGLFYSRRIGNTPSLYHDVQEMVRSDPDYELIKNPTVTQLYNGIKFSGRTKKKLGIGIFNAVTAPMHAELRNLNTKTDTLIQTEPLSNYNILVLDQALKGRSSLTFTNTNVQRKGSERDANVSAFDWSLFTKNNLYQLKGTVRYSRIFGYTPYYGNEINLFYDTVRKEGELVVAPYDGFNTGLQFSKVSGRLQYYISNSVTSNTYDPNDIGYLQTPNKIIYTAGISYNQFTATDKFITYSYGLNLNTQYLYKPYRFSEVYMEAFGSWVFKNFWDVTLSVNSYPTWQHDYFELRTPGFVLNRPPEVTFLVEGSTDSRKRWFFSYELGAGIRSVKDNAYDRVDFGLRYRFSDRFTLSTNFFRQHENNQRGFAFIKEPNGDPLVGFRDFSEAEFLVSGFYNFTSRMNLSLRLRHYWNRVQYNSFYNVNTEGDLRPRPFIGNRNENYNAFNIDAFFTWDFRLGSRIILGWKNWLGDNYGIAPGLRYPYYSRNLRSVFALSHGNELTLRVIYFLDYNQLRKKNK